MQRHFDSTAMLAEDYTENLAEKEQQYNSILGFIKNCSDEIDHKKEKSKTILAEFETEIKLANELLEQRVKEIESREKEFRNLDSLRKSVDERLEEVKVRKNHLDARDVEFGEKETKFKSMVSQLEVKENRLALEGKRFSTNVAQIKKQFYLARTEVEKGRTNLKQKESELNARVAVFKSKETEFQSLRKEVENELSRCYCQLKQHQNFQGDWQLESVFASLQGRVSNEHSKMHDSIAGITDTLITAGDTLLMRDYAHKMQMEAMKRAVELETEMKATAQNAKVLSFLNHVGTHRLVSYFNEDEILEGFMIISRHKLAPDICRSLGFADRVHDFIRSFIETGEYIPAARFICSFGMIDKYPLLSLLKQEIEKSKRSLRNCTENNSLAVRPSKAEDTSIAALKAVIECIADFKLETKISVEPIRGLIAELERQMMNRRKPAQPTPAAVEVQPHALNNHIATFALSNTSSCNNMVQSRPPVHVTGFYPMAHSNHSATALSLSNTSSCSNMVQSLPPFHTSATGLYPMAHSQMQNVNGIPGFSYQLGHEGNGQPWLCGTHVVQSQMQNGHGALLGFSSQLEPAFTYQQGQESGEQPWLNASVFRQ